MDTSETGYSFIRQLDTGAAEQDALRLAFKSRDGVEHTIRNGSTPHVAAPHRSSGEDIRHTYHRSSGEDLRHASYHRSSGEHLRHASYHRSSGEHLRHASYHRSSADDLRHAYRRPSGDDLRHSYQAYQPRSENMHGTGSVLHRDGSDQEDLRYHTVAGPGHQHDPQFAAYPGSRSNHVPPKKKKKKKKNPKTSQDPAVQSEPALMPSSHPPAQPGAESDMQQMSKQARKRLRRKLRQQASGNGSQEQASGSGAHEQSAPAECKAEVPRQKCLRPPLAPKISAPALKNPFLSKMKNRQAGDDEAAREQNEEASSSANDTEPEDAAGDASDSAAHCKADCAASSSHCLSHHSSAGTHVNPDNTTKRPADMHATNGLQDCQQQAATQSAPSHIPLAARIRMAHTPHAHARDSNKSAPEPSAASQHKIPSTPAAVSSAPAAATETARSVRAPAKPCGTNNGGKPTPKPPAALQDVQPNSGGQAASCAQSSVKKGVKKLRAAAEAAPELPANQYVQGKRPSPAGPMPPQKRPHTDVAASTAAADPPAMHTTKPAVAQPLQWGGLWQSDACTPSQPVELGGGETEQRHTLQAPDMRAQARTEPPAAPTEPGKSPTEPCVPQKDAENLLESWMVQEEPGAAGSLLRNWCSSAPSGDSSGQASLAEKHHGTTHGAAREEQGEGGACVRPDSTDAEGGAGGVHAAAAPASNPSQKRRFRPSGHPVKKPSIQLSLSSCAPSSSVGNATVQPNEAPAAGPGASAGTQAEASAADAEPGVPSASANGQPTGAAKDRKCGAPAEHADAGSDAPTAQADASHRDPHESDAAQQQPEPDAATLKIMLQNIAKHGTGGSSTAQIPTRLLQSMAQCMDKLLQQQSARDAQPEAHSDAPRQQHAPDHPAAQSTPSHGVKNSAINKDMATEHEADAVGKGTEHPAPDAQQPQDAGLQQRIVNPAVSVAEGGAAAAGASAEAGRTASCPPQAAAYDDTLMQPQSDAVRPPVQPQAAQAQCSSTPSTQNGAPANHTVQGDPVALMERQRNAEVEDMEWARRQAELEKQRRAAQAERRARAEQNAVVRARAQRQKEQADMEQRAAVRSNLQGELSRVVLPGMSLRQALFALGFNPGPGQDDVKAALKQARVFHHPDSSRRRGDTLRQQIMSEEIFKLLGSLV